MNSEKNDPKINIDSMQLFSDIAQSLTEESSLSNEYKKYLIENGIPLVKRMAECPLPITLKNIESMFKMYVYFDKVIGREHVVIAKDIKKGEDVPLRIHSSCITGESFHAANCDCHEQLNIALELINELDFGVLVWLHQEGRGNGLIAKTKQIKRVIEENLDTVTAFEKEGYPSDQRDFISAAQIIQDLGIKSIKLITNNPDKITQIDRLGIKVAGRIPCIVEPRNKLVAKDLKIKKQKHGHLF